jgi:HSP20 family protein
MLLTHSGGKTKMLVRFDPFREMDRFTEQVFNGGRAPTMAMDAFRHGDRFQVDIDLPGVDPESIDLTVERNVLTVKAERRRAQVEGARYVVSERRQGSFSRQLFLGESLDADHVEARYHDGVLTLEIPVADTARPRRITVHGESGPAPAVPNGSEPETAGATA